MLSMPELLDTTQLFGLSGGNMESLRPIIDDFESSANDMLIKINVAVETNKLEEVRAAAHQLKGTSGMLGMNQLYKLSENIESLRLEDITPTYLDSLKGTLQQTIDAARKALA